MTGAVPKADGVSSRVADDGNSPQATAASDSGDNLAGHAVGWFAATRERAQSVTHLAMAEAKLAALSVALMAAIGVLAAACVIGAWGLVVAGIVYGLSLAGVSLWIALLGMGLVHAVVAYVLWRSALRLTQHLDFKETRAQLRRVRGPSS